MSIDHNYLGEASQQTYYDQPVYLEAKGCYGPMSCLEFSFFQSVIFLLLLTFQKCVGLG